MLPCITVAFNKIKLYLQPSRTICQSRFIHSADRFLAHSSSRSLDHSPAHSPSQQNMNAARRAIRGVIFDMDGTLTVPVIDFAEMRRRVNIPTGDILDVIAGWPSEKQERAKRLIEEVEDEALEKMTLNPGVIELCSLLDTMQIPRALLTRNTAKAVQYFHNQHFLSQLLPPFAPSLARDFMPYKPSPAAVFHICKGWGISPTDTVVIGDSAKDDVVCGNRAGAATILLDEEGRSVEDIGLWGEQVPTFVARSLHEVALLLKEKFELRPRNGLK